MVTFAYGHVEVGMAPVGLIDHAQVDVVVQNDVAAVGQHALVRVYHPAELAVQAGPYERLPIVRHHLHHTLGLVSRLARGTCGKGTGGGRASTIMAT